MPPPELDANIYATYAEGIHRISYDKAVEVMKQTGHDLPLSTAKRVKVDWRRNTTTK